MDNTVGIKGVKAADTNEHGFPTSLTSSHSVAVKALASNAKNILLGLKEGFGGEDVWPLEPGEVITLDLKNAQQLFYKAEAANDKFVVLSTGA